MERIVHFKVPLWKFLLVFVITSIVTYFSYNEMHNYFYPDEEIIPEVEQTYFNIPRGNIHVVTLCDGMDCDTNYLNFENSMNNRGFNVTKLSLKSLPHKIHSTTKFPWKKLALLYGQFAASVIPQNSLMIFMDSSDTFAQSCPKKVKELYSQIAGNKTIVMGMESHCTNNKKCHKLINRSIPMNEQHRNEIKFINGGFVMGQAQILSKLWYYISQNFDDTQLGLGYAADISIYFRRYIALDYNHLLIANNNADEFSKNYNINENDGISLKKNGIKPAFLHVLCHTCKDRKAKDGGGGP